jgi:hypothetical protein
MSNTPQEPTSQPNPDPRHPELVSGSPDFFRLYTKAKDHAAQQCKTCDVTEAATMMQLNDWLTKAK